MSAHILVLVFTLGGLLAVTSLLPITRHYNDGKSDVAGVYLAKGDASGSTKIIEKAGMMEKEDVKVATAGGQTALVNKKVGALSSFPISINPITRQLTVTTPAGTKVVAVLPQQAMDNMLASKVMTDVVGEKVDNELASIPSLVRLEEKNGILGYKVKGTKTHKLFGFIPIKTGVTAFVSAENGQVVESTDSLLGRILNRLAP
ncbi:hypothetical protein HYU45_01525 [Candidatus Daviesbacteria bacterium]|nr:hypothetical protein [Candidatus Daviesbacteria bacterium]